MNNFNYGERLLADAITVSNDTHKTGVNNNDLIIGGSGSGKTSGYVSHMLLNPYGSMVISDTKGILCRRFSKYLKKKGYKVNVIDFCKPENSMGYNPLRYIHFNSKNLPNETEIKKLVSVMFPKHRAEDAFWLNAAKRYMSMLVSYVMEALPEDEQNMITVAKLHHLFQNGDGIKLFEDWSDTNPDSFATRKYKDMIGSKDAEKMWASIMEFANEAIDPFDNEELSSIFESVDSIDFTMIGQEKTVVFLNSSDHDKSLDIICNLFNMQIMQCLIDEADQNEDGRLKVPCRIVLDDFAASAGIEDFDNIISIIRSRDICVSIIIQSISQLTSKYDEVTARTIINNCAHTLYLSGIDPDTAEFVAYHINKTPNSILKLARDKAILISEGEGAMEVNKLKPYFDSPE